MRCAITFAALATLAGWPVRTHVDDVPSRDALRRADEYNYVLGTQSIGSLYRFSEDDVLVDSARAISAMGSNILKISLEDRYMRQYPGIQTLPNIHSPRDLVRDHPSFRRVLDMPFRYILLWVYPFQAGWWADGLSEQEREAVYRQMYDLTAYLLERYNGSGKTFYLGHWEGDWHLLGGYDTSKDPSDTAIQGMRDWLTVRQKAIEDARKVVRHRNVEVYGYAEVNLVQKAMQGGRTVTSHVLPHVSVDYVSYSSYDSLTNDADQLPARLKGALDYIERKLRPSRQVSGKRVFIGEYGFPRQYHTPERQAELSRAVARTAIEWGCPFALYWQMYCNEKADGVHRGFWLIDDKGVKQPVYDMHARYYRQARLAVATFFQRRGRLPSYPEFRRLALPLLTPDTRKEATAP